MSVYIPNQGELEALKAVLIAEAQILGLYKNQVLPDGNTIMDVLEEMPTGGGRNYAAKSLKNEISPAAAADKWAVQINSQGKAEAAYGDAAQEWQFLAADVADGNTVYGAFAYTWLLPFDAGTGEIKVGDTVTGGTSGATGVVTMVQLTSGSWGGGNAAGWLCIKSKTGTFQNDEALQVGGVQKAASNTGATGDAHKKLLWLEAFSSGIAVNTTGQKIQYQPKLTMSSA